jgi:hypothetical protein
MNDKLILLQKTIVIALIAAAAIAAVWRAWLVFCSKLF